MKTFLDRLYKGMMNRTADPAGFEFWLEKLESGEMNETQVISGFLASEELLDQFSATELGDEAFIANVYSRVFNREPDSEGLSYWLEQIDKGLGREDFVLSVLDSEEHSTLLGQIDSAVTNIYLGMLDRVPEEAGFKYWSKQLHDGEMDELGLIEQFMSSREFVTGVDTNVSDASFLAEAYGRILAREVDSDGLEYWSERLSEGMERAEFIQLLLHSDEFLSRDFENVEFDATPYTPSVFQYGVASGDPTSTSVILWSHISTDQETAEYRVEVSKSADFSEILSSVDGVTSASDDFTTKVDFTGLEPGEEYYYRFIFDGETSDIGRTKTLPEGDVSQVDLAVFSCANYPGGFFNAYAEAATHSYDALIHLGDYIYEYGVGEYATETADQTGRNPSPATELLTAEDYSQRYKQYHTDGDLQALRATAPLIAIWDDHETANDSYVLGAENHDPLTEGSWEDRKAIALDAYYNWMPIREPASEDVGLEEAYRSFDFGDLLSLHMLETRIVARDESRGDLGSAITEKLTAYATDASGALLAQDMVSVLNVDLTTASEMLAGGFAQDSDAVLQVGVGALMLEAADPERELMGEEQLVWLADEVATSDATWQVLGQQVLMNQMYIPAPLLTDTTGETLLAYGTILQKQALGAELTEEEVALLDAPKVPYNLDSWDGYIQEREVLASILENTNAVVLAGDTHNAWYADVNSIVTGETFAKQFATPGVSAPGLEEYLAGADPDLVASLWTGLVEGLDYANTENRGYLELSFTEQAVSGNWVYVDTVDTRDYTVTQHVETYDLF